MANVLELDVSIRTRVIILSTLSLYTLIAEIKLHTQLQCYIANGVLGLFDQEEVVCCCFAQAGFVISLSPILYKQLEPI